MSFKREPVRLHDCQKHGPDSGAELFVVEGDSAAKAVVAVRDAQCQAVLPMQGKPINAIKSPSAEVEAYELFAAITAALGFKAQSKVEPADCRFEKIILLFDPDADGIHCGALMLMFFYRQFLPLLEAGWISIIQAPLFRLRWQMPDNAIPQEAFLYSMEHAERFVAELESQGAGDIRKTRYRGLASLEHQSLYSTCVSKESRKINRVRVDDAKAAIAMFGGSAKRHR